MQPPNSLACNMTQGIWHPEQPLANSPQHAYYGQDGSVANVEQYQNPSAIGNHTSPYHQRHTYGGHDARQSAQSTSPLTETPFLATSHPPAYEVEQSANVERGAIPPKILSWIPSPPTGESFPSLSRPVCIPQIEAPTLRSGPMPFLRCYAPDLSSYDITPTNFVNFIDNLNIVQAANPAIQAVQLVGTGIGFVPHHWAQLASGGIGLAASLGSKAVTVTRMSAFLNKVNKEFFKPRGLEAKVVGIEDLRTAAGLCDEDWLPYDFDERYERGASVVEKILQTLSSQGRIATLSLEVLGPEKQGNWLDRASASQVEQRIKKSRKERMDKLDQTSTDDSSDDCAEVQDGKKFHKLTLRMQEIDLKSQTAMKKEKSVKKREKLERERVRKVEKVEGKLVKLEAKLARDSGGSSQNPSVLGANVGVGREEQPQDLPTSRSASRATSGKSPKAAEKEKKMAAKLKWILIENLSEDQRKADDMSFSHPRRLS